MKYGLQIDVHVLRISRSFLKAPNVKQFSDKMAADYDIPRYKMRETLLRLERYGWLYSRLEPRGNMSRNPRRLYGLTPYGRDQAEAAWRLMEST